MKTMNKYETVILINDTLTKDVRNAVISKIENFIDSNGKITKKDDIGSKKTAYEIRKQKSAYYYLIEFQADPETIYELERIYRITDEIIKFIVIKLGD